jgi:hypothetical protein
METVIFEYTERYVGEGSVEGLEDDVSFDIRNAEPEDLSPEEKGELRSALALRTGSGAVLEGTYEEKEVVEAVVDGHPLIGDEERSPAASKRASDLEEKINRARQKLKDLRSDAVGYRDMGMEMPTTGIGNIIDRIDWVLEFLRDTEAGEDGGETS